jgi:hypothetical protein
MRAEWLPEETGGVLMGVVDVAAMRIDVVDAWDQPTGLDGPTQANPQTKRKL